FYSMMDTLDMCQFVWGPAWSLFGPAETVEMVNYITGWNVTLNELINVGLRRINLMRAYNAREGFDRKDDILPSKFFKPLQGSGPTAGIALDKTEFETALDQYYQFMGWTKNGLPTSSKLEELGIEWVTDYVDLE
ncbi:MAG: aldehyde ferredoxin oxidoreductase C-terminal domain-containing protein, partial [Anaerolineales bacterium]